MPRNPLEDVRMKGFGKRMPIEDALGIVARTVIPSGASEEVGLKDALSRLLARDVHARRPVPDFDRSAMDGFAVCATETAKATAYDPAILEVVGESLPDAPYDGSMNGRRAVRIMTGAPMPRGADAVVPAEFAEEARGFVSIAGPVAPGRNRSLAGEEYAVGALVVAAGRLLRPQDVGALAALGVERVPVAPRPRVSILATGNELVRPGEDLGPFQVYDSNTSMLSGLIERWGGRVGPTSRQPDEPARISRALNRMLHNSAVDLVLLTGGTSVGVEDCVPGVLAETGILHFHGLAMRPAGPVGYGVANGKPVFLLPGNPMACLCAMDLLVGPAMRRIQGFGAIPPYPIVRLPMLQRAGSEEGRTDYVRVALEEDGVVPVASRNHTAIGADGFVVIPGTADGIEVGQVVEVHLYG